MTKKKRKEYPIGTFLPTSQRVMATLQLCFAFSLMLWYLFQPFMGEYFEIRSRMLLYEFAMGTSTFVKETPNIDEMLKRQSERFHNLPFDDKKMILKEYKKIQSYAQRPLFKKIGDGIRYFILQIPVFELAWIVFSIVITILLLKKVDGAKEAVWLLPIITFIFALDNQMQGINPPLSQDNFLFPTEKKLIEQGYFSLPVEGNPKGEREELERGWHRFLIDHWGSKNDPHPLENAEFNFTVARLKTFQNQTGTVDVKNLNIKLNPWLLGCYLLWNIIFALNIFQLNNLKTPIPAK